MEMKEEEDDEEEEDGAVWLGDWSLQSVSSSPPPFSPAALRKRFISSFSFVDLHNHQHSGHCCRSRSLPPQ
ncbi:hypothetical protein JOB18_000636 [Solea senegalensis]|uniref:Uncharacterized protein n=1 Tax=Solea senegalensis TaxID=28829 RepID=A0AAV6QFM7_SOLSE|nr:hypothetical protein JOB18_000636 [Solea senegalensis]